MKKSLENAKKEGLTIKNLKTFGGHDGMMGINADIYKDGKKVLHIYDDAWGGPLDIQAIGGFIKGSISPELTKNTVLLKKLTEKYPYSKNWEDSLEGILNELVTEELAKKDFKKIEKKGIVLEDSIVTWNAGTISNMLKKYSHQKDKVMAMVQKGYDECIADGEKVLNTVYLESIGINL